MRNCVLTLVERVTGFVQIKKLSARTKGKRSVNHALAPARPYRLSMLMRQGSSASKSSTVLALGSSMNSALRYW